MHYRARFISLLRVDQSVKFSYTNFINFSTFSYTHKPASPRVTSMYLTYNFTSLSTIYNDKMAKNFFRIELYIIQTLGHDTIKFRFITKLRGYKIRNVITKSIG
jgi:hypothetical protein